MVAHPLGQLCGVRRRERFTPVVPGAVAPGAALPYLSKRLRLLQNFIWCGKGDHADSNWVTRIRCY